LASTKRTKRNLVRITLTIFQQGKFLTVAERQFGAIDASNKSAKPGTAWVVEGQENRETDELCSHARGTCGVGVNNDRQEDGLGYSVIIELRSGEAEERMRRYTGEVKE
jgi:hypothetical protein